MSRTVAFILGTRDILWPHQQNELRNLVSNSRGLREDAVVLMLCQRIIDWISDGKTMLRHEPNESPIASDECEGD